LHNMKVQIRKRIALIFILSGIAIVLLIARLGYVQLVQGEELSKGALNNRLRDIEIKPKRGAIYDRNGNELAVSVSTDDIGAFPTQVIEPEKTARAVAEILELEYQDVYKKLTQKVAYVYLKKKVDIEVSKKLKELDLKGIDIVEESRRFYPKGNLASHVLGFVNTDNIGANGIEVTYNKELLGNPGRKIMEYDAQGNDIPQALHDYIAPEEGNSLYLAIDEVIQYIVERELDKVVLNYKPKNATIIAVRPKTGEILALANRPDYEPTSYTEVPAENWWNFAISGTYEPGSTFKTITISGALEEAVVKPEDRFYDPGYIKVADRRIHCWKPGGHGAQSFTEVVQNSCNPGFIEVGLELGKERFYKYINAFGFGAKTGIQLPGEGVGLMYAEKDVKDINLATISIGQSISVTPIQLVMSVAAIANEGVLMKPQLVKEIRDKDGKLIKEMKPEVINQVISKETSAEAREMLESVVAEGTGRNAYIKGYRVAGKTGTAQKAGASGGYSDKRIASFVGFAPANDPEIAMLVIIDEPQAHTQYGGQLAAPVFKAVITDVLKYLKVAPQVEPEKDEAHKKANILLEDEEYIDVEVPSVIGLSLDKAIQKLKSVGLKHKVEGQGNVVINQYPPEGVVVYNNTEILLTLGNGDGIIQEGQEVTVPDLKGTNMREAISKLESLGLKIQIEGSGIAFSQGVEAGKKVKAGTTIPVKFASPSQ